MTTRKEIRIAQPETGDEELEALRDLLRDGWLGQGPRVSAFECAFAARHGVLYGVATTSGTTALHVILAALGIGPGDEVIVPAFTWVSTANAVLFCGATPVLADVDPRTFNIDPAEVAKKLTPATRAVIPVHLFGLCADVDAVANAAPGIPLVEDAACAAGALYRGRHAGSLGAAAMFSFHPRKVLTTGEGGMITTADQELSERMARLRNHSGPTFNLLGYNYRMTDLQAAIGLVQLTKLDRYIQERARAAELYSQELASLSWLRLPETPPDRQHSWQSFVCMVDEEAAGLRRDDIIERLAGKGIEARRGTHAVHRLGLYRDRYRYRSDDYPVARDCERLSLALPLHNRMTGHDYEFVIEALRTLV